MAQGEFLDGYKVQLKEAFEDFTIEVDKKQFLRISDIRADKKEILKRLNQKGVLLRTVPYLDYGYEYESKFPLSSSQEYLQGNIYIQDAPSQFAVEVLDPKEGDLVLDMCAAPGSKTTYLAQRMKNKGNIVAIELIHGRIDVLANNLTRMGVTNTQVYQKDSKFLSDFDITFDKILLDAPCSGNFCIEEDWFHKRSRADAKENSILQKALLKEAVKVLKPGGVLVYSTCSLEVEEDEQVVEWALENLPVTLEEIKKDIGLPGCTENTKLTRKFWPHLTKTQGFFIAKFKKTE